MKSPAKVMIFYLCFMKIYLLGYMGCGKTNLGREMAAISGMAFADLDELFEAKYRVSIMEFFDKYGEQAFRALERDLLRETAGMDETIISTGGGTPCFFDNMDFILSNGLSVYLRMPVGHLAKRLNSIRKRRPLLKSVDAGVMEEHVTGHLAEREPYYLRATLTADGPAFDAAAILRDLGRR